MQTLSWGTKMGLEARLTSHSLIKKMALKYCGKDYGSEQRNAYFVYRMAYHLSPIEAFELSRYHTAEEEEVE